MAPNYTLLHLDSLLPETPQLALSLVGLLPDVHQAALAFQKYQQDDVDLLKQRSFNPLEPVAEEAEDDEDYGDEEEEEKVNSSEDASNATLSSALWPMLAEASNSVPSRPAS